jgi:hypothetical protein
MKFNKRKQNSGELIIEEYDEISKFNPKPVSIKKNIRLSRLIR